MNDNDVFSLDGIISIQALDEKAILNCDMNQYFIRLTLFLRICDEVFSDFNVVTLLHSSELLREKLKKLAAILKKICAYQLVDEIEFFIQNEGSLDVDTKQECLKNFVFHIESLYFEINMCAMPPQGDGMRFSRKDRENSSIYKAREVFVSRPTSELTVEKMVGVLRYIESFQLIEAGSELNLLCRFSYGAELDSLLNELKKNVESFGTTNAKKIIAQIMPLVDKKEQSVTKKILAVDDNVGVLNTIKAMLKGYYHVVCIPNPQTALRFLSTYKDINLILLDIEMPKIDGYEMMDEIMKIPGCDKIPIIILTGNATKDHIYKAMNSFASDFLGKPVDLDTLLKKIRKHIRC